MASQDRFRINPSLEIHQALIVMRLLISLCFYLSLLGTAFGQAAITVINANSSGPGSFQQAVADIDPNGVITFSSGLAVPYANTSAISKDFTVDGEGQGVSILPTDINWPIIGMLVDLTGAELTLRRLSLPEGSVVTSDAASTLVLDNIEAGSEFGGIGLLVNSGVLNVQNSIFFSHCCEFTLVTDGTSSVVIEASSFGIGGHPLGGSAASLSVNSGLVDVTDSDFGGMVQNDGAVITLLRSIIQLKDVYESNGALNNISGSYSIIQSRLTGWNFGVQHSTGTGLVRNSILTTYNSNPSPSSDFALNCSSGQLVVENSSLIGAIGSEPDGSEVGLKFLAACDVVVTSSIITGQPALIAPAPLSGSFNLISDPDLDPYIDVQLGFDGLPLLSSPVLDQGDCAATAVTQDLNGNSRPYDYPAVTDAAGGDACDIGAVERGLSPSSIVVVNANYFGTGSLDQAITEIADGGVITFDTALAGQSIPLRGKGLPISWDYTIDGENQDIVIAGGGARMLADVSQATMTFQNIDLRISSFFNYNEPSYGILKVSVGGKMVFNKVDFVCDTGCIEVDGGELMLTDSQIFSECCNNSIHVKNSGTASILRSQLNVDPNAEFDLGGLATSMFIESGDVEIRESSTEGIYQTGGNLDVFDSRLSNFAQFFPLAALQNFGGSFNIYRSELIGEGGGVSSLGVGKIYSSVLTQYRLYDEEIVNTVGCNGGSLLIANSTVTSRSSEYSMNTKAITYNASCDLDIYSSLIHGSPAIAGPMGEASGEFANAFNLFTDPNLDPWIDPLLISNRSPSFQSPLIDKGDCALHSVVLDRVGAPRPFDTAILNAAGGDGCDIGAFERQDLTPFGQQVDIDLVLSGAWNGTDMSTALQAQNLIPLDQPYDDVPDISVDASFLSAHPEIVDWVWIQASRVSFQGVLISMRAVFLTKDGKLLSPDGSSGAYFFQGPNTYHLTVGHRNHLSVRSATGLALTNSGLTTYDLKSGLDKVFTNGGIAMQELGTNIFGLWGGDGDASKDVSAFDFLNVWLPNNGGPPDYGPEDFNLSGAATALDFLDVWLPANGQASQVPD